MHYTKEEVDFLIKHYEKEGLIWCSEKLQRKPNNVSAKICRLKLKHKPQSKNTISSNLLTNITPEFAYILGLWWADGYLAIRSKRQRGNRIRLQNLKDDVLEIKEVFNKVGNFNFINCQQLNQKPTIEVGSGNKELTDFLLENDYAIKSKTSPTKILSIIPKNLYRYFFLGLIDGDGCWTTFYRKTKSYPISKIVIVSTFDQDWGYVSGILNELSIKYSIHRAIHKVGKSSSISIYRKEAIKKIQKYIYPNGFEFGLRRKYLKSLECIGEPVENINNSGINKTR